MISTLLLCEFCRKPYDMRLDVYDGADLGSDVRFWCRACTRPRVFRKILQRHLAQLHAAGVTDTADLENLLTDETAFEEQRAASLERPIGAARVAA